MLSSVCCHKIMAHDLVPYADLLQGQHLAAIDHGQENCVGNNGCATHSYNGNCPAPG